MFKKPTSTPMFVWKDDSHFKFGLASCSKENEGSVAIAVAP